MRELWFQGPNWLSDQSKWPQQPEVAESVETTQERVQTRSEKHLFAKEEEGQNGTLDALLDQYASYWKLLRVTAFARRFTNNCREMEKQKGPLTT